MRIVLAMLLTCALAAPAQAQPETPMIADPHTAWLVEGRVLDAAGRPVDGVEVVRVAGARGDRDYQEGGFRVTTNRRGEFRFEFSGLGIGAGRVWHLRARRAGCRSPVVTVRLRTEPLDGREADVARRVVVRLPRCRRSRGSVADREISSPAAPTPPPPPRTTPTRTETLRAIRQVSPAILECGRALEGALPVRFVFDGASGEATAADLVGDAPRVVRSCVTRAGQAARVPPFDAPSFTVQFPFRFRAR